MTLRSQRMYEFLERLVNDRAAAYPRLSVASAGAMVSMASGNYNFGITEQIIFPENRLRSRSIQMRGMNITITTIGRRR